MRATGPTRVRRNIYPPTSDCPHIDRHPRPRRGALMRRSVRGAGCGVRPVVSQTGGLELGSPSTEEPLIVPPCAKALKWCSAKGGQGSATGETGPGNRGPGTVVVEGGRCASPASANPGGASLKSRGGRLADAHFGLPAGVCKAPATPSSRGERSLKGSWLGAFGTRERDCLFCLSSSRKRGPSNH